MNRQPGDSIEARDELMRYGIGLALALLLTVPVFAAVAFDWASRRMILVATTVAALLQIVVHLRCFLHLRLRGQTREDLQLVLFSTLILALMAGGTIWLMSDLAARM